MLEKYIKNLIHRKFFKHIISQSIFTSFCRIRVVGPFTIIICINIRVQKKLEAQIIFTICLISGALFFQISNMEAKRNIVFDYYMFYYLSQLQNMKAKNKNEK